MEEKYGIEVMRKGVLAVAQVLSVVYDVFILKAGIWKLFGLQSVIQSLVSMDFAKLKQELSDLSEAERESVQADFKAALPAALQSKIGAGVDLLEQAIDVLEDAIAFAKKSYADVMSVVAKAKSLVGA